MTTLLIIFGILIVILFIAQIALHKAQLSDYDELATSIKNLWLGKAEQNDIKALRELRDNDNEVELDHYHEVSNKLQDLKNAYNNLSSSISSTIQDNIDTYYKNTEKEFADMYDRMNSTLILIQELQNPPKFKTGNMVFILPNNDPDKNNVKNIRFIITKVNLLEKGIRKYELQEVNGSIQLNSNGTDLQLAK